MLVLGIDTSAVTASVALCEVGEINKVIATASINSKITHSQTLEPMIENMFESVKMPLSDVEVFAVSGGPGSFTGLRIGISAVKGMAFALGKPCVNVSTLHGLAYNLIGNTCIACAVMDARCNQVYNALFRIDGNKIERITEDRALLLSELQEELSKFSGRIIFVGDGAELCEKLIFAENVEIAPPTLRYQRGESVCFASAEYTTISAKELMPKYLRLPQAERERIANLTK